MTRSTAHGTAVLSDALGSWLRNLTPCLLLSEERHEVARWNHIVNPCQTAIPVAFVSRNTVSAVSALEGLTQTAGCILTPASTLMIISLLL